MQIIIFNFYFDGDINHVFIPPRLRVGRARGPAHLEIVN